MPVVEESKQGLFSNPTYGSSGLGNNSAAPVTSGSINPSQSRLNLAGLVSGGVAKIKSGITGLFSKGTSMTGGPGGPSVSFGSTMANESGTDWRVRVSIHPDSGILYRDTSPGILTILQTTDGVIFPYVPSVTVSYAAKYGTQQLTHTNYTSYFYESSEVNSININGDFAVQDTDDATYFLAVLQFFRATTKMFYGKSGAFQGSPPPIVYLDGFGAHYLPHVPCVVTQFSHTMPADVDYLEVATGSTYTDSSGTGYDAYGNPSSVTSTGSAEGASPGQSFTRVPTMSSISLSLQPVYSRAKQTSFDYAAFARGDLISKGML